MQLIEVTDFGVRSAVVPLRRAGSQLRFIVFPMVHMASPRFYEEVERRVAQCQLAVDEASDEEDPGPSRFSPVRLAFTAYARFRRRGERLVYQYIDYQGLGVPVVRPDLSAEQQRSRTRGGPLGQRILLWLVAPWFILFILIAGPRWMVKALGGSIDDDFSRQLPLEDVLLDERDRLLMAALSKIHEERGHERIDVAVVYGAAHVPAIVHGLLAKYGYRPRNAEWITVFDL